MKFSGLFVSLFILFLTGCSTWSVNQSPSELKDSPPKNVGYLLMFTETLPGKEARDRRMIITDRYVRVDDGQQGGTFELFNRNTKALTKVSADGEAVLTLAEKVGHGSSASLHWTIFSQESHVVMRSPDSEKNPAMHYRFYLDSEPCFNVVTIDQHLLGAAEAMREYNQVVADHLKKSYQMVENQQCRDALMVFSPNVRLQQGFPLREWSSYGYRRFLIDYKKDVIFPDTLFKLPAS